MRFFFFTALTLLLASCGRSDRLVREWQPADHVPPPEEAVQAQEAESARIEGEAATMTDEEREARAALTLFGMSCAPCHGAEGGGDGPAKPPMAHIPNFADPAWQEERTDDAIRTVITQGRGLMPSYGNQLPEQAISALVRHIRTLAPPP